MFGSKKKEWRKEALQDYAKLKGLEFFEKDTFGLVKHLSFFKLMEHGSDHQAHNVITNQDSSKDFDFNYFDFHYLQNAGKTVIPRSLSVFFVESKQIGLADFNMYPTGFWTKIGKWFGMQDINFDAFPVFSENYVLQSPDTEFVVSQFDPPVLRFFSFNQGWHLEGLNYYFVLYQDEKLFDPAEVPDFIEKGMAVFELFKEEQP